jgi:hypothetical protein
MIFIKLPKPRPGGSQLPSCRCHVIAWETDISKVINSYLATFPYKITKQ